MTVNDAGLGPLQDRIQTLERQLHKRRYADAYARFYAPMALLGAMLVFQPIFDDVVVKDGTSTFTSTYGTLWEMAGQDAGGPAVVGLVLVFGLIALLGVGAFGKGGSGLGWGVFGVATLIVLMLLTKPGTGTPTPDLSIAGKAGLGLGLAALLIGAIHGSQPLWHPDDR
jgi:hypothetical protein